MPKATPPTTSRPRVSGCGASIAGVTDADNPGDGSIVGPVAYHWQVEARPGTGIFEDIRAEVRGNEPARAEGATFIVTPDLAGLSIRVRAVLSGRATACWSRCISAATAPVIDVVLPTPTPAAVLPDGKRCVQRRCASGSQRPRIHSAANPDRGTPCGRGEPPQHHSEFTRGVRSAHGRWLVQ